MAATPEQKHAAEALIRIRRVGNMYAGALGPPGRLLADGALVGPAGDRLSEALTDRYRTMRSAISTAFDQARHMAGPEGLGATEPYLGTAPLPAPRPGAEIRSGDPGLIDSLVSELTDAGSAWENAGRELSTILDSLGLSPGPGDDLRRAGIWIAKEADDLRQRRLLLRASVPTPAVNNTYKVTPVGWGPGSNGSGGFWDFLDDAAKGIDVAEGVASLSWDQFTDHFLPGLRDGTVALGKFLGANNPYTAFPYAITDFHGWLQQTPVGVVEALYQNRNHPLAFAKAAVNWDMWANDPVRAFGEAIPSLLLTVATGGVGATSFLAKADEGAIRAAERAIAENAAKEADNSKGIVKTPPGDKKVAGTPPDKPVAGGSKDVPVAGTPKDKPVGGAGTKPKAADASPALLSPEKLAEISAAIPNLSEILDRYGASVAGQVAGQRAHQLGFGARKLSIIEQAAEVGLSQAETVKFVVAASRRAFEGVGGTLKLANGDVAVLPTQPQVKDTFIVSRSGEVTARKTKRSLVDGELKLEFLD